MLDKLNDLDEKVFLFLNGLHNSFFDFIMYWASDKWVWIPFYVLLVYLLYRNFGNKFFFIMLLIGIMITISDQVSSALVKQFVQRPRPCHEFWLSLQVHLVKGECGGEYGFFSSHASNSFALSLFLIFISKKKLHGMHAALVAYATLVSYSRIYLGAHYPGDVITGILFGWLLAWIFSKLFFRYRDKIFKHQKVVA